jgi:hypothetical protein
MAHQQETYTLIAQWGVQQFDSWNVEARAAKQLLASTCSKASLSG